jgi:GAF domain-containing protein
MQFKTNFQDLANYLMPGIVFLLLLIWFSFGFIGIKIQPDISSIGALAILLILGYVLGSVAQAAGNVLEGRYEKKWKGKYGDIVLRSDNDVLTSTFKAQVIHYIQAGLHLDVVSTTAENSSPEIKHARMEAFHECQTLLVQSNSAQRVDIFQGLYGLYRGLLAVGAIGMVISALIFLKQITILGLEANGFSLPNHAFFTYDEVQLIASISVFVLFAIARLPLYERLRRFAEHYAVAVYQSFYAWCVGRGIP